MNFVILTPWKLTGAPAKTWSEDFLARISRTAPVSLVSPSKALESEKAVEQFLIKECEKIISDRGYLFFLDERGTQFSSDRFSAELVQMRDRGVKQFGFVFGGAHGLPAAISPFVSQGRLFSLSQSTLAHELSLVVLLEQLYRAECIRAKHPYHHGDASPLVGMLQNRSSFVRKTL